MSIRICVRVITNSYCDEICGFYGEAIKIKIKAKPVDGKANLHLIKFLSKKLSVNQNDISIIKGISSREKILEINHGEKSEIYKKLGLIQEEP